MSGLLYPYMLLNILLILCLCLISHNPIDMVNIVKQRTLAMILGISFTNHIFTNVESVSVIWFMVCLFFSLVIFNIILNIAKDKMYIRFSLSAVVCILGWLIGTRIAFLPWSFDVALVSIIFLEFGYELRKNGILFLKESING